MTISCRSFNVAFTCLLFAYVSVPALKAQETATPATTEQSAPNSAGTDQEEASKLGDTSSDEDSSEKTEPAQPNLPFNRQPYLTSINVAFSARCLPNSSTRNDVMQDIDNAVARMFGQMFDTSIQQVSWLAPGTANRLKRLSVEDLLARFPETQVQKAFLVSVEEYGNGFRVSVREFDSRVHEVTPIFADETFVPSAIGQLTARLIRDAFRPVTLFKRRFINPEGREVLELTVQAGDFPSPDPTAEQVVEGDILRPFLRQMDRRSPTTLNLLRPMPLSYIRILSVGDPAIETEAGEFADVLQGVPDESYEDVDGRFREVGRSSITGVMLTHLPAQLFGSRSRAVQHIGLRQRPTADASKVRLVLRGRKDKPLISHRIALAYQLHWKDPEDPDLPQVQLVSDRNGEVVIERNSKHPTFWIRVYSGASLLARVPYAPGLIPFDTVELPDDSIRLGVEGEIKLLQDELIDAIALRGVLLARARKAAEKGNAADVDRLLKEYATVNAKQYFLDRITNVQVPAANAIKKTRMTTTRIDRLCKQLRDSVEEFFSDENRAARQQEIEKLRLQVDLQPNP